MNTVLSGWDFIAAICVVIAAVVVEKNIAPAAVALTTLFGVALTVFALFVSW